MNGFRMDFLVLNWLLLGLRQIMVTMRTERVRISLRRRALDFSAILFNSLDKELDMADTWLPSLITATPQEGFELAITLSRRGVKYTQPDMETLKSLRSEYAQSADGLTAASQVIAINFQTVSAANNYWRS